MCRVLPTSSAKSLWQPSWPPSTQTEDKQGPVWLATFFNIQHAFQAFWRLRQRCHRTKKKVFFPQLGLRVFLASLSDGFGSQNFIIPVLCRFRCPKCLCFLTVARFLAPFPFNVFVNGLTKRVPVRIHQRRSPPLELNMLRVDEGSQRTHTFSPRSQFVDALSVDWKGLPELRLLHTHRLGTSAQATHIHSPYGFSRANLWWCFQSGCHHLSSGLPEASEHWQDFHTGQAVLHALSRRWLRFAPLKSCLGARQSYWPPHAAHHQQQCFFFLLLPSHH